MCLFLNFNHKNVKKCKQENCLQMTISLAHRYANFFGSVNVELSYGEPHMEGQAVLAIAEAVFDVSPPFFWQHVFIGPESDYWKTLFL